MSASPVIATKSRAWREVANGPEGDLYALPSSVIRSPSRCCSMTSSRSSLFGYCIGERLLTAFGEPIEKHQIHFGSASIDVTLFD
jgi:hypothetical protein